MRVGAAVTAGVAAGLLFVGWMAPSVVTYRSAGSMAAAVRSHERPGERAGERSDQQPVVEPGPSTAVPSAPRAAVASGSAAGLDVAAVGLSTSVGTMVVPSDEVIRPPSFDAAYEIVDPEHGYPGQAGTGTVFVALHSSGSAAHADAPGNALVLDGLSTVQVGDLVTLRGEAFTVTRVLTAAKDALATTDEVWEQREGRLVLVTCVPRPGYAIGVDNLVVIAERP